MNPQHKPTEDIHGNLSQVPVRDVHLPAEGSIPVRSAPISPVPNQPITNVVVNDNQPWRYPSSLEGEPEAIDLGDLSQKPNRVMGGLVSSSSSVVSGIKFAAIIVTVTAVALTGGFAAYSRNRSSNSGAGNQIGQRFQEQDVQPSDVIPVVSLPGTPLQGTADTIIINGDLVTQGAVKLYSGSQFSNIVQGTITADQTYTLPDASGTFCLDANNCRYATAEELAALQARINNLSASTSGSTAIAAGSGIVLTGTTISNTGVLTINGISPTNGNMSLTAGSGISIAGTVVTNTGVRNLTAGGNIIITDLGNGNYEINDVGAGASTVTLGAPSIQNDTTNNPSIHFTKNGTGNLLQLATGPTGTPTYRFVVDQTGAITTGTIDYSQVANRPSNIVNTFGGVQGTVLVGSGLTMSGQTLLNNGVTSVNGSGGTVTLTGGTGISVTGTSIANTGVTSLTGTANQVSVSGGTGAITISLPQSIAVASSPTFAGLTVDGNLTLKGTSSGANNFSITGAATGNRTITLPDATGTVCLTTGNCAGAGGGVIGSGTNNSIPKFTVTGSTIGDSSLTDDGTNVTTSVDLIVQGGSATIGTALQDGAITLYGNGFTAGINATLTGNHTFDLPDGSGEFCIKQLGNCSGTGGGNAPTSAQYLTLALDGGLSAERTLSFNGTNFTIFDNGVNNSYVVNTSQSIATS
jgi:hypothetical protein